MNKYIILLGLFLVFSCDTPLIDLSSGAKTPTDTQPTPVPGQHDGPQVRVRIEEGQMVPEVVRIRPGIAVTWANISQTTESISLSQGPELFDSGPLSPGQTFFFLFTKPGIYKYSSRETTVTLSGRVIVEDVNN